MSTLKQVIHYQDTNSVEATWVDENDIQIKCHSYSDVQMDMLRAHALELGTSLSEYEALIAQVEAAIVPYVPPSPVVPEAVTMRQARLALLSAGMLTTVKNVIAALPGAEGEASRIEWEYAAEIRRDAQLVAGMAIALNLTEAQLDDLFLLAGSL